MVQSGPGQGDALTPQPSLSLPALRQAVATVAPGRLPEMFTKMQEAFVVAGEQWRVSDWHCKPHPEAGTSSHSPPFRLTLLPEA